MKGFRYDTHVHTEETSDCGKVKGREVARLYKKAGYQGVVITDHYCAEFFGGLSGLFLGHHISWEEKVERFLTGYREALAEGESLGLQVFLGMELRFLDSPNDYLVYGIDEDFLREYPELYKLNLREFYNLLRARKSPKSSDQPDQPDILIYQAHPFRPEMTPADPSLLDGVEVFNGNPRHDSRNDLAYSYAKKHRLRMISGSDFHQVVDLARGGIILPKKVNSVKEFVLALTETGDTAGIINPLRAIC